MRKAFALLWLWTQCAASHAALGAAPTDFGIAQAGLKARILAFATSNYSVNETTLESGTLVREYVNRNGVVFAVSWKGPFLPDLRALLGKHFDTLTSETAKKPKAGHSQVSIARPDVVIVSRGHMRAYAGRAWMESEFPAGFAAANID